MPLNVIDLDDAGRALSGLMSINTETDLSVGFAPCPRRDRGDEYTRKVATVLTRKQPNKAQTSARRSKRPPTYPPVSL